MDNVKLALKCLAFTSLLHGSKNTTELSSNLAVNIHYTSSPVHGHQKFGYANLLLKLTRMCLCIVASQNNLRLAHELESGPILQSLSSNLIE